MSLTVNKFRHVHTIDSQPVQLSQESLQLGVMFDSKFKI